MAGKPGRKNPTIKDPVPDDCPGAREIGFSLPENYNASDILFANLERGLGDKTAIHCPAGDATYGELCRQACRVGNGLLSLGLQRGDRILLFLADTAAYPAIFFGAVKAGLVPMLTNTLSPPDLIRFYLEDSGAKAVLFDADFDHLFSADTLQGTEVETLISVNGVEPSGGGADTGAPVTLAGDDWFPGFSESLEAAPTGRDDMAFWMYSSGSTGRPKGIIHLQHDVPYIAESFGRHILEITRDDICFSVPKVFFAYGFGNSLIFPFSVGASSLLLPGRPAPGPVFEALETYSPTIFFGLPTLYSALINHEASSGADLSSLRLCISAAEVLSAELFNSWKDRYGLEIVEGLGSTEALHMYLSNSQSSKKPGAAGRRVPGYEVALKDKGGKPVSPGEDGGLWLRGHSNTPSYWNRADKTRETMRGDWLWTGDRFVEDGDGFFFFRGRADDLIKISGQWVYPLEIELCLAEHPMIRECAVFGLELPDRRMTTKAAVVLKEGFEPGDETTAELQAYVKKKLLPYKYPRIVEYLDELPKTGTGKLDRLALRMAAEKDLAES